MVVRVELPEEFGYMDTVKFANHVELVFGVVGYVNVVKHNVFYIFIRGL